MPRKINYEKQVEKFNEQLKKIQAKKNLVKKKANEEKRKERTKRLIEIGAIMDSIGITSPECAKFFKDEIYLKSEESKNVIDKKISEFNQMKMIKEQNEQDIKNSEKLNY